MTTLELTHLLRLLVEAGKSRGTFLALTIAGNGQCRALWQHYAESFTLDELAALLPQPRPLALPEDLVARLKTVASLRQAGQLAEARAQELTALDQLLQLANRALHLTPPTA